MPADSVWGVARVKCTCFAVAICFNKWESHAMCTYVQYTCVWERLRRYMDAKTIISRLIFKYRDIIHCMYTCVYIYMYIYMCTYIYIYTCTYTIIYTLGGSPRESWVVPPVVTVPILPCSRVKPSGWWVPPGRQWRTPSWISWSHWSVGWIAACQLTGSHLLQGPW